MNHRRPRTLAPWRFMLIALSILLAIPCGIAAADPVWNGADLACFLLLAMFIAALTLRGKDKP